MAVTLAAGGCVTMDPRDQWACATYVVKGFRDIKDEPSERFLGKVQEDTARCRGGERAVARRNHGLPWVDWTNYWATGNAGSQATGLGADVPLLGANGRGVSGALLDLEYQRMELIKFNLFDNSGTYRHYVQGRDDIAGPVLKEWDEMRLPKEHPQYEAVGGYGRQLCTGDLIRFRNLTGICTDIRNPLMGSTGQPFARNVQFEATYPDLRKNELARNRHGNRLGPLKPDPQVISRKLFTRAQSQPDKCRAGHGLPGYSADADCEYKKAPFFNVLAAFWVQFMTHDWFSHLEEGHNASDMTTMGCATQLVNGADKPLTPDDVAKLGCRPDDQIDKAYISESGAPPTFIEQRKDVRIPRPAWAYKTTANKVTAWWDASQIYGYDAISRKRVKQDPRDPAKLLLLPVGHRTGAGETQGYLPVFGPADLSEANRQWTGQEATAFPDNWSVGLSFFHNVFAREHNFFVDEFRKYAAAHPEEDSGLRNPEHRDEIICYRDIGADAKVLFEVARLVISAEIAKIHTIEWTTQLLYDEPLYLAMNANWHGLMRKHPVVKAVLELIVRRMAKSHDAEEHNQLYSAYASGLGIFGIGNRKENCRLWLFFCSDVWSLEKPRHINGGINHFGSPFNFPEEFVTVYRLHTMVPDLLDYREWDRDPNAVVAKIPVIETFSGKATQAMEERGLANWALSLGRQRLGALALHNHPQFLQNLPMPRLQTKTNMIDVAALDLIRDRERGVPRFNEFRRQYGLKSLKSFDDFVDQRLPSGSPERVEQERVRDLLREVYGRHTCDASKIITKAQAQMDDKGQILTDEQGNPRYITDCLGHSDGDTVDNIEDLDTVVGWLAEPVRPHGFAISETQFQVFILNASRRLFSDRFFTSSFRPEFYTHLGVQWVTDNGPDGKSMEKFPSNGHEVEVSPLKRVLLRTIPELAPELERVVNVFDPWARDRGEYYTLEWSPRPDAVSDPAFK